MFRFLLLLTAISVAIASPVAGQPAPKKMPPAVAKFLQASPEELIRRLDKNQDGYLSSDELPPRLANAFDRFDSNGDGKLDAKEVARMQAVLRQRFAAGAKAPAKGKAKAGTAVPNSPAVDQVVARILSQMDKNGDGKISRDEAQNRIRNAFDQLDTNKDGFLDKSELRAVASRFLAQQGGGPAGGRGSRAGPPGPDFDAFDKNADGRLTREELRGTRFYQDFDRIDANKDGKITPKEFAAYLKQSAAKAKTADEKE